MTTKSNGGVSGGTVLRAAFDERRLIRVAGVHDAISAIVANEVGFDALWASGLGISAAAGVPDMSFLGLTDYLAAARNMIEATNLPLIADCDTGFGNSINAAFVATRFERIGAAAICLEDKVFPKRNSFALKGQQLEIAEEFAQKIAATAQAKNKDLVLIARTESLICGCDINEAIRRCALYVEAGADAVLIHSKRSEPSEVKSFLAKWKRRAPVVIVPTTYSGWHSEEAVAAGVDVIIYANQALRAGITDMRRVLQRILDDGTSEAIEDAVVSVEEIFSLTKMSYWAGFGK